MAQIQAVHLLAGAFKWALKPAQIQVEPINLVASAHSDKVASIGLINHVSAKLGDSDLKVPSKLGMKFNASISAQKCQLGVICVQGLELYNLGVNASLALHGELSRLKDFDSWWINACGYDVPVVIGDP